MNSRPQTNLRYSRSSRKTPLFTERRLSTASQKIALFRHLAQMQIRLAQNLPYERLSIKEQRQLNSALRLLISQLQRLRL